MVIKITGGEGCQRLIVEAVRRGGSGFDDVAFVKLESLLHRSHISEWTSTNAWMASLRGVNHFPSYTT